MRTTSIALIIAAAFLPFFQGCTPETAEKTSSSGKKAKEAKASPTPTKDLTAGQASSGTPAAEKKPATGDSNSSSTNEWTNLFDGRTLAGWKSAAFGGEGNVSVQNGAILMEMGGNMTGITWTGKVLRDNYEIELEGRRVDGSDFFCTTTFPVGKDSCSFVVGGWGGGVIGLSNVDGRDASENSTTQIMSFKQGQWYRVRIRVTDAAIEAWIDGERVVHQPREGHQFSIRSEVELCRPLGISTWTTKGEVRNIRMRSLEPKT